MGGHPLLSVGMLAVARTGQAGVLKGCPVCVSLAQPLLPGHGDSSGIVMWQPCQAVCGVSCSREEQDCAQC